MVLGVLPDEKRDDDEVIFSEGFMFLIQKGILKDLMPSLTIDYVESGLRKGFKVYKN